LLSPTDAPAAHLSVLADVARIVGDRRWVEAMREAVSEDAMVRARVEELIRRFHKANVLVSTREGNIRAGIHFYNNEEDVDRLLDVL